MKVSGMASVGRKRTKRATVEARMRLDAATLEKKIHVSTAMFGSEIVEIDALADANGSTRSQIIRDLALDGLRAMKAA